MTSTSEQPQHFQRGDHVRHKPSGEEWILRRAGDDWVEPAGWPPSRAMAKDCELVESVDAQRARGARVLTDDDQAPYDPHAPGPPREVHEDAAAREAEQMAPEVLADILHALGRPDDPMRKTYRNYYCGTPEGHDTPLWRCTREAGEVCPEPFYSVTDYGREQAAKAMKAAAREEKMHSEKDMLHEISPLGSYAHGDYCCTCRKCSRPFIGDKRAIRCLPCAIRAHAEQARAEEREAKDQAYSERNQLVALLARLFPSGVAKTDIPGWDDEWRNCVYIDLPTGQASWHFHVSDMPMFEDLPPYEGEWDGHTTQQKYQRLANLAEVTGGYRKAIIDAEREACAQVCSDFARDATYSNHPDHCEDWAASAKVASILAGAIRQRSEAPNE